MARKPTHKTMHTAGEVENIFEDALALFGGRYDKETAQRVLAIPIDGALLRNQRHEIPKPDSNFYAQSFGEALSVIRLLVALDLDSTLVNIERRDHPDVCAVFSDRGKLYVEQTTVMEYEGMPFARHLEEINAVIRKRCDDEPGFRAFCDAGNFTVRLTDPGLDSRATPAALVEEIERLSPSITAGVKLLKPVAATYPLLATYHANVFYHVGHAYNPSPCNQDGGWFDPRPAWVAGRLREALEKKRDKARKFFPSDRPLWLLMNLSAEQGLYPPYVPGLVNAALEMEELEPYDRVVVSYPGVQPMIFDPVLEPHTC